MDYRNARAELERIGMEYVRKIVPICMDWVVGKRIYLVEYLNECERFAEDFFYISNDGYIEDIRENIDKGILLICGLPEKMCNILNRNLKGEFETNLENITKICNNYSVTTTDANR